MNCPQSFSDKIQVTKLVHKYYEPTDPDEVTIFATVSLERPYKKIGTITVNRYNQAGIKRQQGVISDLFRWLGAEIGGHAVIHIQTLGNRVSGEVVRFIS